MDECPVCKHKLDAATKVNDDNPPKEGDYSVCIVCASLLRLGPGLRLRLATQDDVRELYDNQPDTFAILEKMIAAASQLINQRRREKYRRN